MIEPLFSIKHTKPQTYSEASGNYLKYTLLDGKDGTKKAGLHWPVICKDFISDAFWSEYRKQESRIYSFSWKPGTLPVQGTNRFMMGLHRPPASEFKTAYGTAPEKEGLLHEKRGNLEAWLNVWDSVLKLSPSTVWRADDDQLIVDFDAGWTERPAKVSFLTLLARIGMNYDVGQEPMTHLAKISKEGNSQYSAYDLGYVGQLIGNGKFQKILTTGKVEGGRWDQYPSVNWAHIASGIVNGRTEEDLKKCPIH